MRTLFSRLLFFLIPLTLIIDEVEGSVFVNQKLDTGMPLGGLGTGKIELMTDGSFDRFSINNNPHQLIRSQEGCFAAVAVSDKSGATARRLIWKGSNSKGMSSVRFNGVFPFANVTFTDPDLPVSVKLHTFSPLIAGNKEDSSFPAAAFIFTLKNESDEEIKASLAMSWSNLIGLGGTANRTFNPAGECQHEIINRRGSAGIRYQFNGEAAHPQAQNALGNYTLLFLGERNDSVSFLPMWNPHSEQDIFWSPFSKLQNFPESKKDTVSTEVQENKRPAAAISAIRSILPQKESTFVFIFAWYMPHLIAEDEKDYGLFYTNQWDSSYEIAREMGKRWQELEEQTKEWQRPYLESTMPGWLVHRAFNGLASLPLSSVFLKDGTFSCLSGESQWPGNLHSPEELFSAYHFLLHSFPELLKQEINKFAESQLASGEIPSTIGNIYSFIGEKEVPGSFLGRPDSVSAFILIAYDYYLWTGDKEFIEELFPNIQMALYWLMRSDINGDNIPDGPSLWHVGGEGLTNFITADFWLAAIHAGEEMAEWFRDYELSARCRNIQENVQKRIISQLWNGRRFQRIFFPSFPVQEKRHLSPPRAFPGELFGINHGWQPLLNHNFLTHTFLEISHTLRQEIEAYQSDPDHNSNLSLLNELKPGYFDALLVPLLLQFVEPASVFTSVHWINNHSAEFYNSPWNFYGKPSFPSSTGLGVWSMMHSLSGISVDMHRQCLITGAVLPSDTNMMSFPLQTPVYSGEMQYKRSTETGQEVCQLFFDQSVKKDFALKQLAFRVPPYLDAKQVLLRVMLNDEFVTGQDFSRESLRVYNFETPQQIRRDDTLTLLLAMKNSGTIFAQPEKGTIYNYGVNCRIEQLSQSLQDALSYRIYNRLHEQQIIHLEIQREEGKEYDIYLNGEKLIAMQAELQSLPIVLRTSPISYEEFMQLRQAQKAYAESIRHIANLPARNDLKRRLWSLQDTINEAVAMDSTIRGIQIDIREADSTPPDTSSIFTDAEPDEVIEAVSGTQDEIKKFLDDLDELSGDPILASNIAGYFTPLSLEVTSNSKDKKQEPFQLNITINNPLTVPVSMRIQLNLPENWQASTQDTVFFESTAEPASTHHIVYSVTPADNLWDQRYPLEVTLAGTWKDIPFRREETHVVGHEFLTRWLTIGPFPNQRGEGFEKIYPLEMNIKPEETYSGVDQTVRWEAHDFPTGYIDFNALFSPNDYAVGYAYAGVYSPREQPVRFEIGSTDGIKIFHNYKEIFMKRRFPDLGPSSEELYLKLFEGWNHILVKVAENTGEWGFYFEITDLEGRPIPELQYALDKL